MKIVKRYPLKIDIFIAVKNHCILHGRVFVMVDKASGSEWFIYGIKS